MSLLVLIFFPNYSKYRKLAAERRDLKIKIEELKRENARLEEEKHKLETDIEYIEKRAREKLGVVRENEIPYRFIDETD